MSVQNEPDYVSGTTNLLRRRHCELWRGERAYLFALRLILQPKQSCDVVRRMDSHSLHNRLLLALPPRNLKQLMPDLEFIRCQNEQILLDADASLDNIFFPDSGVISMVAVYVDGNVI